MYICFFISRFSLEPGSGVKVVKVRPHNAHTYASVATSDAKTKDGHTSKSVSVGPDVLPDSSAPETVIISSKSRHTKGRKY